jgi:hypothetical protein
VCEVREWANWRGTQSAVGPVLLCYWMGPRENPAAIRIYRSRELREIMVGSYRAPSRTREGALTMLRFP